MKLEADSGGEGARLFLLLHGLGATRDVWRGMTGCVRGRWIAPDLRGHGASPHGASYTLDDHAADVAALAGDAQDVAVVGHSMGGAIALALASRRHGIAPSRVFGLGIKVAWNDDELASMRRLAASPVRFFESRNEAAARYLKVAGLAGLVAPHAAERGVAHTKDGWRLAYDPAVASIGPPPMVELMAHAKCPIHLARGESDAMAMHEQLTAYDPQARDLPGGHNAMVEHPHAVWDWIEQRLA